MPIYLGTKKLTCGYFGTIPLSKTFFGEDPVCTSCAEAFPEFPDATATARFSMMIKSSDDLMVEWTSGSGLRSLIESSSNYVIPNWGLVSHGTDTDGNYDFELTCASTITMFQFARNRSNILNIQLAKSVDHLGHPSNCKYYYSFTHLPNLETVQFLSGTGAATNMCRMFWDNRNLKYVDLPKSLFGRTIDYERMFKDTPRLRFISYLSTRNTISGGRVGMFENSSPLRPSGDERSALMVAWGSRFQFDICRMFDDDNWKTSDKTAFSYWRIVFNNKQYGGNHHSSLKELYAYSAVDGYELLEWGRGQLASFSANQETSGYPPYKMIDRNNSTYWLSYHWGNGHFEWHCKTPRAYDSIRLMANGHASTNAGDSAAAQTGRDFRIEARNKTTDAWTLVKMHRVADAGNYGNWSTDENRTLLIDD